MRILVTEFYTVEYFVLFSKGFKLGLVNAIHIAIRNYLVERLCEFNISE